jgi:hypothetical protein
VSGTLWLSAGFGKFYSVSVKVYRQEGVCPSWFPEILLLRPRSTPNFIMKLGTPNYQKKVLQSLLTKDKEKLKSYLMIIFV